MYNQAIVVNKKVSLIKYLIKYFKYKNLLISKYTINQLINNKQILVNNNIIVHKKYILRLDDQILIKNFNNEIHNTNYFFEIIYEDSELIVINKPNNLIVYSMSKFQNFTLVDLLLKHKNITLSTIGGKERPGIIHRIDRQTTGLLVIAKNNYAHIQLQYQIQNKYFSRQYVAIVHGVILENKGKIIASIGRNPKNYKTMIITNINAKFAITHFTVIKRFQKFTYIKCILETGRTHQIRVHFKFIKHPVFGDPVYGYKSDKYEKFGQYLHAYKISFKHFKTNKDMLFKANLPNEMQNKLDELEQKEEGINE